MGRKSWGIYGVAIALVGLIGVSFALSPTDARSQDERVVLDDFTPTISSDDCLDSRTTAGLERPRASNWLEVAPAERHMLDIASDRAVDRGADVPVFSSLAESTVMQIAGAVGACHGRIKIGRPRFYGEYAFVTESEKDGASTSAYRRTARGWAWMSLSANGGSVQY
jgi:hypothetical protein